MSQQTATSAGGFVAGSRVGRYLLEEQVGHGGMAAVYRARDEQLGRVVALKILAPALASDEAFRRRFVRESKAAAAVDDPHIIPLYEAGESDGVLFIAMRYVPGGDVRTLLFREGPLPPDRVAALASPVASALDAAHASGLVHRDVKPANMLLDSAPGRPDHLYLSDFGLSKGATGSVGLTSTGLFLGTVDYAAPEQINGAHVDGRTDQYSLGCAAFEMLAGEPPFRRDHGMAVLAAHVTQPPPLLSTMRPGLPSALDAVFAKVLAKSPDDRYRTCGEFSDALRAALGLRRYDTGPAAGHPAASRPAAGHPAASRPQPELAPTANLPAQDEAPPSPVGTPPPAWPAQPPSAWPAQPPPAGYAPAADRPTEYGSADYGSTDHRPGSYGPASYRSAGESAAAPAHIVPGFGPPPRVNPGGPPSQSPFQANPPLYQANPSFQVNQPLYQPDVADTHLQRRSLGGRWPLIVAAAVVAIALAVGIPLIYGHKAGPPAKLGSTGANSPAIGKTPTGRAKDSPQQASPQPSWSPYQDPGEFSIDLPPDWSVESTSSDEVRFAGPQPGFVVLVEWTNAPQTDAAATWRQLSAGKAAADSSYHEISIQPIRYRDYSTAADWKFTDQYPAGEDNEFYDRGFVVHPGTLGFAIELYGPVDQFESVYASLWSKLTSTFQPAS
jgi:serine/threonine protein kinase